MNRAVTKTIDMAYELFDSAYANRTRSQVFHFATLSRRNKILAIGQNHVSTPSPKATYFAKRFGTPKKVEYPFIHAEIDCISKLWGKCHVDNSLTMVVVRLNRFGEFSMSRPCRDCQTVLDGLGLKKVFWTTKDGVCLSSM